MENREHTEVLHGNDDPSDTSSFESNSSSDETIHLKSDFSKERTLRESIVGPAWSLVMNASLIKKFNFFPSLLATIWLGCIILYQIAFSYVYIFQLKDQFFGLIIQWVHTSYFWQVLGVFAVGIILYIFITPIAEGGLISLIAKRQESGDTDSSDTK